MSYIKKILPFLLLAIFTFSCEKDDKSIDESKIISIPDPNLKKLLYTALKKDLSETITEKEAKTLDFIFLAFDNPQETIKNLSGIEYFENLQVLSFYPDKKINNVDLLKNLKITSIVLSDRNLKEDEPLELDANSFPKSLTSLSFGSRIEIKNISSLKELSELDIGKYEYNRKDEPLELDANSFPKGLTSLSFGNRIEVKNISSLKELSELRISTSSNRNTKKEIDIAFLENLPKLTSISYIGNFKISNQETLKKLKNLEVVNFDATKLEGLDFLKNSKNTLKEVLLPINSQADFSNLSDFPNLTRVKVYSSNSIELDLTPLLNKTKLIYLYVSDKDFTLNIKQIKSFKNLRWLFLPDSFSSLEKEEIISSYPTDTKVSFFK